MITQSFVQTGSAEAVSYYISNASDKTFRKWIFARMILGDKQWRFIYIIIPCSLPHSLLRDGDAYPS